MSIIKILVITILAVSSAVVSVTAMATGVPESTDPIKIVLNNWTSQLVQSHIAGDLLKKLGYNVEYKPSDSQLQFTAIGNGDMDLQMEVWQGTMKASFDKQIKAGRMVDAGSHKATTREEWWYPLYVEKLCPGLPDWKALNACAKLFSTPETAPKGRYLAGPVDWQKPDKERIAALHLNYEVINAGAASALWAELKSAVRRKAPIILFNWTPNWVGAVYPGHFVNFPDWSPKCESDASWGINPKAKYDCGNPKNGYLKKGVWSGFPKKWSCGYQLIKNISFTNAQVDKAAAMVDVDRMKPEAAAAKWIKDNQAVWKKWIPTCAG